MHLQLFSRPMRFVLHLLSSARAGAFSSRCFRRLLAHTLPGLPWDQRAGPDAEATSGPICSVALLFSLCPNLRALSLSISCFLYTSSCSRPFFIVTQHFAQRVFKCPCKGNMGSRWGRGNEASLNGDSSFDSQAKANRVCVLFKGRSRVFGLFQTSLHKRSCQMAISV